MFIFTPCFLEEISEFSLDFFRGGECDIAPAEGTDFGGAWGFTDLSKEYFWITKGSLVREGTGFTDLADLAHVIVLGEAPLMDSFPSMGKGDLDV